MLGGQNVTLKDSDDLTLGSVTASGKLDATVVTDITLNGTVSVQSLDLEATSGDLDISGDVAVSGGLNVNAGANIRQGGDSRVTVGGESDLKAKADIRLEGAGNDFQGSVNAAGRNLALSDVNSIRLGNVLTGQDLKVTSGGDILQDNSEGKTLWVEGMTELEAVGTVVLDGKDNKFTKGVTVKAASYLIEGDTRKSAGEAVSQVLSAVTAFVNAGLTVPGAQAPQPLVFASGGLGGSAASGSSDVGGVSGGVGANSAGVNVEMLSAAQQNAPLMVAVSLPRGAATVGTGFSFELPASVKAMVQADAPLQITLTDGSPLPDWLRFDREQLRFEASAVPDGGLPLQLELLIAGQRVTVVISERTE